MTHFSKILPGALLVLFLSACTAEEPREASQAEAGDSAGTDHVWKEQVETIDRAKSVEDTIKEADEAKRKAMKDAGGG